MENIKEMVNKNLSSEKNSEALFTCVLGWGKERERETENAE